MKNKSNKDIIFIISIICSFLFVGIFNYVIDPFCIFHNKANAQNIYWRYFFREKYLLSLFFSRNTKYESVLIGGCNITSSISPMLLEHMFPNKNIKYLTLFCPSLKDYNYMLNKFADNHPETKTFYIALETNMLFNDIFKYTINPSSNYFQNIDLFLFSKEAFTKSLKVCLYKILQTKPITNFLEKNGICYMHFDYIFPNVRWNYKINHIPNEHIKEIISIENSLKEKGRNVVFFIPSYHSLHLSNMKIKGYYTEFEKFKKELVNYTNYYDFAYVAEINSKNFPKPSVEYASESFLFFDTMHPTDIMGQYIVDVLINEKENAEYGILITQKNVDKILKKQNELLNKYIKENNTYVSEYSNKIDEEAEKREYNVKRYFKDEQELIDKYVKIPN